MSYPYKMSFSRLEREIDINEAVKRKSYQERRINNEFYFFRIRKENLYYYYFVKNNIAICELVTESSNVEVKNNCIIVRGRTFGSVVKRYKAFVFNCKTYDFYIDYIEV